MKRRAAKRVTLPRVGEVFLTVDAPGGRRFEYARVRRKRDALGAFCLTCDEEIVGNQYWGWQKVLGLRTGRGCHCEGHDVVLYGPAGRGLR